MTVAVTMAVAVSVSVTETDCDCKWDHDCGCDYGCGCVRVEGAYSPSISAHGSRSKYTFTSGCAATNSIHRSAMSEAFACALIAPCAGDL
eukprot:1196343-Prorocentrum_minimum.AAC.2